MRKYLDTRCEPKLPKLELEGINDIELYFFTFHSRTRRIPHHRVQFDESYANPRCANCRQNSRVSQLQE